MRLKVLGRAKLGSYMIIGELHFNDCVSIRPLLRIPVLRGFSRALTAPLPKFLVFYNSCGFIVPRTHTIPIVFSAMEGPFTGGLGGRRASAIRVVPGGAPSPQKRLLCICKQGDFSMDDLQPYVTLGFSFLRCFGFR